MSGRKLSIVIALIFTIPMLAPTVVGEWKSDNWLANVIGPERLTMGDEFGCQGYEGLSINEEPWTIAACRDYLIELTDASNWGAKPISFGLDGVKISPSTESALIGAGFEIAGDANGTTSGLRHFGINGGTLEKNLADKSSFESTEQHSLVSIAWIARIHDLKVREDQEFISWLEQQEVWFTTWGEWHHHQLAGSEIDVSTSGSTITANLSESYSWAVPGTIKLQFEENISSVSGQMYSEYPQIEAESRHLKIGWRQIDDGILLTVAPGTTVTIELEAEADVVLVTPWSTFNGLHHAVTIVGKHTTNLFHWSSDFQGSDLRFTWLVERPSSEGVGWMIPAMVITVLIAVPVSVRYLVGKDANEQIISRV